MVNVMTYRTGDPSKVLRDKARDMAHAIDEAELKLQGAREVVSDLEAALAAFEKTRAECLKAAEALDLISPSERQPLDGPNAGEANSAEERAQMTGGSPTDAVDPILKLESQIHNLSVRVARIENPEPHNRRHNLR